ncbi:hypothetical protein ES676_13985 [Bizionia saleffrena]|uniref:O-antigen ligase family protein n=1 Tax=Bizionia saleffrena TaxID=291189 RepID=A0A8H2LAC9_9FLAO|nr:hypothetical protein [Bizionia saleffrena]TYB69458.1 hypothetical protein ES676_13985 [Bizionia saleffrena]
MSVLIKDNTNKHKALFYIILLLSFFMPHSSVIGQSIAGVLPFVLFIISWRYRRFKLNNYSLAILLIIITSFTINVIAGEINEFKDFFRLLSFCSLFLLFPFTHYFKVPLVLLYIALGFIFISQIAYAVGVNPLVVFFDTYFPYEGETVGFTSDFLQKGAGEIDFVTKRRYGGIYHNPNQAVKYVSVLFLVYLIEAHKKKLITQLPFIIMSLSSVLLSGSRTGFIVIFVLWGTSLVIYNKIYRIVLPLLIGFFFMSILIFTISNQTSSNLRIFDVVSGFDGSIGTKMDWFLIFFSQLESPIKFLFGHFSTGSIYNYGLILLDSEWGELFYCFGFVGFILVGNFYLSLYRTEDKNIRLFLLILLWGVSSTILFSFRMSFIFMFFLSNYYSLYLSKK